MCIVSVNTAKPKNIRRTFVDASVLQWGQIKHAYSIYLFVISPPFFINNTDAHLLLFTIAPIFKMCVNIGPSYFLLLNQPDTLYTQLI